MEGIKDFISVKTHLTKTFNIYKKGLKTYLALTVFPAVFSLAITFAFLQNSFQLGIILSLVNIPVYVVITSSLYYAISHHQENPSIAVSLIGGLKKLIPLFFVGFLSSLIITGGYLFFVIPGLIFSFWFSLSYYLIYTDNVGGMNALLLSRDYIKGSFSKVFFRFLLLGVFSLLISAPLALVESLSEQRAFGAVVTMFYTIFFTPFAFIYIYVLYSALKQLRGEFERNFSKKRKLKYAEEFRILSF